MFSAPQNIFSFKKKSVAGIEIMAGLTQKAISVTAELLLGNKAPNMNVRLFLGGLN
jgi:hypothetical protein